MYPQYNQPVQPPNLDYMGMAAQDPQFAQYLASIALEILKYFGSTQANALKNFGLSILQQNNYANASFEEVIRISYEKSKMAGGNIAVGVAEAVTLWLALLMNQYPDLWNKLDSATALKVKNVLQSIAQPQAPQYNPQLNNTQMYNSMMSNNQNYPNMQNNSGVRMGVMSGTSNSGNNATAANRYNMGNEQTRPAPANIFDRYSTKAEEVLNVNRHDHKINPVSSARIIPNMAPAQNAMYEDPSMKVNVVINKSESLEDILNVGETIYSAMREHGAILLDSSYGMCGVFTEAFSETWILTKQMAYDSAVEYLENIILGKSNKNVRYPTSYRSFIKGKSKELTKLVNKLIKDKYGASNAIDDFVEDFNQLINKLQSMEKHDSEFSSYVISYLTDYLIKSTVHVVSDSDTAGTSEKKDDSPVIDIIGRKINLFVVNLCSSEFELFYSKANLGLPNWLDQVEDWFELHIVTTDNILYINESKSTLTLEKIGKII